jgi:hypothetical protein
LIVNMGGQVTAMLGSWDQSALWDLRWHWGSAYRIDVTDGRWFAAPLRGRDRRPIGAEDAETLRLAIRADYWERTRKR